MICVIRRASGFCLALSLALGLSACNDDGGSPLHGDWVQDGGANPSPSTTPEPGPSASPSPGPEVTDLYTGPASVAKYVQKFVDDAKIQGLDVTPDMKNPKLQIQISSLDGYGASVIGLCETSGSLRRVTFDPDFWDDVSETQRELLAHHELGHCVLYRPHRTAVLSSGAYASIMYPVIMSSSEYLNDYDYYQEELFTWGASQLGTADANGVTTHICDQNEVLR